VIIPAGSDQVNLATLFALSHFWLGKGDDAKHVLTMKAISDLQENLAAAGTPRIVNIDLQPIDPSKRKGGKPMPLGSWDRHENSDIYIILMHVADVYTILIATDNAFPRMLDRYGQLVRGLESARNAYPRTPLFGMDMMMQASV